jgi:hypothetical protein
MEGFMDAKKKKAESHEGQGSAWRGFAKALFIVLLTVVFFLLARSMVYHHFCGGGRDNYGGQH